MSPRPSRRVGRRRGWVADPLLRPGLRPEQRDGADRRASGPCRLQGPAARRLLIRGRSATRIETGGVMPDMQSILRRFAVFGLPGLALFVFLFLLNRFNWEFEKITSTWAAVIAIIFIVVVTGVT